MPRPPAGARPDRSMTDTDAPRPSRTAALPDMAGRLTDLRILAQVALEEMSADAAVPAAEAVVVVRANGLEIHVDQAVAGPMTPEEALVALAELELSAIDIELGADAGLDGAFDVPPEALAVLDAGRAPVTVRLVRERRTGAAFGEGALAIVSTATP